MERALTALSAAFSRPVHETTATGLKCERGHPIVKLTENLHCTQVLFRSSVECDLCKKMLGQLDPRWTCMHTCRYNVCDTCYYDHWTTSLQDAVVRQNTSALLRTANAVPPQMHGIKEYKKVVNRIPASCQAPNAIGLLLEQAWNVPEASSMKGRVGKTTAAASMLAPAGAGGIVAGPAGAAVGLAVGAVVCGIDQLRRGVDHGMCHPLAVVEILSTRSEEVLAAARSHIIASSRNPAWKQVLTLPSMENEKTHIISMGAGIWHRHIDKKVAVVFAASNTPPQDWNVSTTLVKVTLYDASVGLMDPTIGYCTVPLTRLLANPNAKWLVSDSNGDAVLGTREPFMPCEVSFTLVRESLPSSWQQFLPAQPQLVLSQQADYPCHVFMMTRGTRGDVQPFLALARGLAEKRGWMVTICTEMSSCDLVKEHSNVSRGCIRFRPSGGNTEARMSSLAAKLLLRTRTEFLQMMALANSEAEFFASTTVFIHQILEMEKSPKPVDIVMFGFTLTGIASIVSEFCRKPIVGYILQPSSIPSSDASWKAVQAIHAPQGRSLSDVVGELAFTSHGSLKMLKKLAEHNPFATWNIDSLRKLFHLGPTDTWKELKRQQIPIMMPIREGIFERPEDWWDGIQQTDFIFLRKNCLSSSLGDDLDAFLDSARREGGKTALMSFSSMPVPRKQVLRIAIRMLENCRQDLRFIFVGRHEEGPDDLEARARDFKEQGKFFETARADFGILFPHIDCFIVHGGLGTTVEAMRMKKPCCVTGPLLLDQRFWGQVCFQKGIGPEPVFIDDFVESCCDFINSALDPTDPMGWQKNASTLDWGPPEDDGVEINVSCLERLLQKGLSPLPATPEHSVKAGARMLVCCSSGRDPSSPISREDAQDFSLDQHLVSQADMRHSALTLPAASTTLRDGGTAGRPGTGVARDHVASTFGKPSPTFIQLPASTTSPQLPIQSIGKPPACLHATSSDGDTPSVLVSYVGRTPAVTPNTRVLHSLAVSTADKLGTKVTSSSGASTALSPSSLQTMRIAHTIACQPAKTNGGCAPTISKAVRDVASDPTSSAARQSLSASGPTADIPNTVVAIDATASGARWQFPCPAMSALPTSQHGAPLFGYKQAVSSAVVPTAYRAVAPRSFAAPGAIPAHLGYQRTLNGPCICKAQLT